ncbi:MULTISPECIES: flagellar biosynthesis anti-sigma factor FlgM [unclassified Sphingomonas]|jgi:negative regulator of flagellin synthesis FlgM|uniref:flagellar biosynthesis anti-sigma factor FlgM n=1 Tax=unclassified Sphingomonas TaxID=196159 RepID=UPI000829FC33|nr:MULTISPECIES: flagellar biosynthesis anti-sigma factor FlgM [unclassified Sphingomonas]
MVDPIGFRPISATDARNAPVAPVTPVQPVEPVAKADPTAAELNASETARALAAAPPVDVDRVHRIRSAVQDGTFPILPATIADRLIALRLQWSPHDQSA